mgnify:CR=1 FL=1
MGLLNLLKNRFFGVKVDFGGPENHRDKHDAWWKRLKFWTNPMRDEYGEANA